MKGFYIVYFHVHGTLCFSTFLQAEDIPASDRWYISVRYVDWAREYEVWGTDLAELTLFPYWRDAANFIEEHVNAKIVSLQSA